LIEQDAASLSITGNKKFDGILGDIGASIDKPLEESEVDKISRYFTFNLSRNPGKKYERIISLLKQRIKIRRIKDISFKIVDKTPHYYFGLMTEIRYGYRGKLSNKGGMQDVKGVAGSLGGVYGNLKDDSDFVMLTFDSDIYKEKKDIVEHCAGKFILTKASHPWRTTSISGSEIITDEELVKGEGMAGLKLKLADKIKEGQEVKFSKCEECELCSECTRIVKPSVGVYNVMIVGEAPGKEEDREGKGFVGRSGDMLWKELGRKGLSRRQFYVTNVVKCWPSKTKTPTGRQISKCSKKWLDEEIAAIKPVIILAFGNTALRYFTGEEKGIMAKNGTCEWNNKAGAWVCYCIHPASVLYHDENMELFKKGIANFAQKAIDIGGLRKEGDSDDE
jgi:DNA polymerase